MDMIFRNNRLELLWKVPAMLTSLVGREQEIAEISVLLTQSEIRLLTLLGTGGIGKTRLSIAAAAALRSFFTDGIAFIALASE